MTLLPDGKSGPVGLTAVAMTTEDNDYAALVVEDPAVLGQRAEDAGAVVNWAQSVDMEILCVKGRLDTSKVLHAYHAHHAARKHALDQLLDSLLDSLLSRAQQERGVSEPMESSGPMPSARAGVGEVQTGVHRVRDRMREGSRARQGSQRNTDRDGTVRVRPATVEDYPRAHDVIVATFDFHQQAACEQFRATDSPAPTRNMIEELLRDDQGAWFLAEADEQILGFVTVRLRPAAHEPYLVPELRASVDSLGILPAWQRRGIGQRLMAAVEQWAREHGARRILLSVWAFNAGALGFYDTLGYTTFTHNLWKAL
jgi:ribosomal protein S18 acetylase RimI-like enzyme